MGDETTSHDLVGYCLIIVSGPFANSLRVGEYLYDFADYLEMENPEQLFLLGALHDIGKIKISTSLLNKKERLTGQEFDEIKRHTLYGENIIKNVTEFPPDFSKAILYHHEKYRWVRVL